VATDAYGEQILQMTHASLVGRDGAGDPLPDLAQRWESPDPLTYVFHLRAGLRFHDGRPLTSADVRYTFAWILDASNRSPHRGLYLHLAAIETPDPQTIIFRLSEPFAPFLSTMVRGIVRREVRRAATRRPWGGPLQDRRPLHRRRGGPFGIRRVSRRSAGDPRGDGQVPPRQQRAIP